MISRRSFLRGAAAGALSLPFRPAPSSAAPEVLYNGISLGTPWPPRRNYPDEFPVAPPYLLDPPAVIPVDVGRQLFVDDFLIEESSLMREWHRANYHPANPVLRPETPWEHRDDANENNHRPTNPAAMVFSDGVFFDPADRVFKMWYMGGYGMFTCLATSADGLTWERPSFDIVPGTNIVVNQARDSSTVWLDQLEPDRRRRFKMSAWWDNTLRLWTSPDGIHWLALGRTGRTEDRTTFFQNPFRNVWVFSMRANQVDAPTSGRFREYWETPDFTAARSWSPTPVAWIKADSSDWSRPGTTERPQLYNLDCVAYESVLFGLFSIWRGESSAREKINEITVGFSRDGFHWDRPDRATFIGVSDEVGSWNWANVQSAGGCCLIVGDALYFYVSGRQGRPGTNAPGVCSTGLATLRRDGFASMDWRPDASPVARRGSRGYLTTRTIRFSGSHLFVNADLENGELRAEVLDRSGRVIAPFTQEACMPVTGNGTRLAVKWSTGSLAGLASRDVRLRFSVTRGRLYAFWISADGSGRSGGYVAAGGPEFQGPRD